MKKLSFIIALFILVNSCATKTEQQETTQQVDTLKTDSVIKTPVAANDTFKLIVLSKSIPGNIDSITAQKLPANLKALAALYSAMGGSLCDGENCKLTTALGLGKQGSDAHKAIIQKYFPADKAAAMLLKQDCYLPPSTASVFSDYQYLNLINLGDTVKVDYSLMTYNHGESETINGPDVYLFKDNTFKKIKRNIYAFADK